MKSYEVRNGVGLANMAYVKESIFEAEGQCQLVVSTISGYMSVHMQPEAMRGLAADLIAEANRLDKLKAAKTNG